MRYEFFINDTEMLWKATKQVTAAEIAVWSFESRVWNKRRELALVERLLTSFGTHTAAFKGLSSWEASPLHQKRLLAGIRDLKRSGKGLLGTSTLRHKEAKEQHLSFISISFLLLLFNHWSWLWIKKQFRLEQRKTHRNGGPNLIARPSNT